MARSTPSPTGASPTSGGATAGRGAALPVMPTWSARHSPLTVHPRVVKGGDLPAAGAAGQYHRESGHVPAGQKSLRHVEDGVHVRQRHVGPEEAHALQLHVDRASGVDRPKDADVAGLDPVAPP